LFRFDIDGDIGNDPNALTLWFGQPDLGLPSKEYYEEKDIRDLYRTTIEKMLLTIMEAEEAEAKTGIKFPPWPWPPWGDDDKKPENKTMKAARLSRQVLKFESEIAAASADLYVAFLSPAQWFLICRSRDALEDPVATYNPIPFSEFQEKLPEVEFNNYIATFAPRSFPTTVIVTYPPYMRKLSTILSSASMETIEAYFVVRTALTLAPRLGTGTEAWKVNRQLIEVLSGLKKGAVGDRAEWCVTAVDAALGYASGRFFVAKAFAGDSKRQAASLISSMSPRQRQIGCD
jgi:endothelin-converting enzyme